MLGFLGSTWRLERKKQGPSFKMRKKNTKQNPQTNKKHYFREEYNKTRTEWWLTVAILMDPHEPGRDVHQTKNMTKSDFRLRCVNTYDWAESNWFNGSQILEDPFQILHKKRSKAMYSFFFKTWLQKCWDERWSTFFLQLVGKFPTNTVLFSLILSSAKFRWTLRLFVGCSSSSTSLLWSISGALRLIFFGLICTSSLSALFRAPSL